MAKNFVDSLNRLDMINRAIHLIYGRDWDHPKNGEHRERLNQQDIQVQSHLELRQLYFETVQCVHYLGNCGDDTLTEHDREVEHPLMTKAYYTAFRRINAIQTGYWEWVYEQVKKSG